MNVNTKYLKQAKNQTLTLAGNIRHIECRLLHGSGCCLCTCDFIKLSIFSFVATSFKILADSISKQSKHTGLP